MNVFIFTGEYIHQADTHIYWIMWSKHLWQVWAVTGNEGIKTA